MRPILYGTAGALAFTVLADYIYLPIGDALVALIGFLLGYWLADRAKPLQERPRALSAIADRPPRWVWIARRGSVILAALTLFFGDRLLFHFGIHGLPRKLGAVLLACGVLAASAAILRRDHLDL